MFMNLDTLPAGKSMYTLYYTTDPEDTPRSEMSVEELDLVFNRGASWGTLGTYAISRPDFPMDPEACRLVGVVDQSAGYVVFDAFLEGIEQGANDL